MKKKVLIFIVCYNAEKSIESVLDRIPKEVWKNEGFDTEILIIDDQSADHAFHAVDDYARKHPQWPLTVLYNPKNQGYGGNQKIGFHYAIKNGFDVIVLLHGGGQYAPEHLPQMIQPIIKEEAEVVLGSRMIRRFDALKDRMPLYKWFGNQVLTFIQNRILNSSLAEFHTGYRAYSVPALASVPFEHNSYSFDFDTDIIIQMLNTGKHIKEIPVPVFYGKEISIINGIKYAIRIIRTCILSRTTRLGIYFHPKFDYEGNLAVRYQSKFGYPSSHQFAFDHVAEGTTVLDIGCGPGFMAEQLARKNVNTISVDRQIEPMVRQHSWKILEADVDHYDFNSDDSIGKIDTILALDIIEHLHSPEKFLTDLRKRFSKDAPAVIITTGNTSFFPLRIRLLMGGFHYGKRGILDMDHKRLFTFSSLKRTLEINGYDIIKKCGIPAPFPLAIGDGRMARFLLQLNQMLILLSKGMFAYQIAMIAKPKPTLEQLLENTHLKAGQRNTSLTEQE